MEASSRAAQQLKDTSRNLTNRQLCFKRTLALTHFMCCND